MQKNVPFIIEDCKIFLPKMSRSKNIAIAKFEFLWTASQARHS